LPMIAVGGAALLFGKNRWSIAGRALLALGLLLLGLYYMKDSVTGLQQSIDFRDVTGLVRWQFVLFGLVVAAVIQSSSATIMLTLTALNAGIITLPDAAAVVIGADLGTTTTLLIGSIKGSAEKKRVAAAHVIFNATNATIALALLPQILHLIEQLGLHDPLYVTVAFHSTLNTIGLIVFLPMTGLFARRLERLIPDDETREARYLSEVSPDVSDAAMAALEHESSLLIARAVQLASAAFEPMLERPAGRMPVKHKRGIRAQRRRSFEELYRANKHLGGEIFEFAVRLQASALTEEQSARLEQLLSSTRRAIRSSKSIKDIRHNLIEFSGPASKITHVYLDRFRQSMEEFLGDLFALREKGSDDVTFEDLAAVMKRQRERHDDIHRSVYRDISDGGIAQTLVFTLLNVNRELMNCQSWLVLALGRFHLNEGQAEDLQQLPR
ncbi:MAG: Na/Pi symporter, partial [Gammaproteobacteria bacterium]|nr:Na/Pi symporter [Gammaproteobacteria bacterium]